jgi:hypothetical protein
MTGPVYIGEQELPWESGVHRGPDVYDPHVDYGDGHWTLTGMAAEYVLYSAAVIRSLGITFDPVALYWEENQLPLGETPYEVDVGEVVLSGLVPPEDRTLFACPRPYAAGLLTFMDRMSFRSGDTAFDSLRQVVRVVDWPMVRRMSVVPSVPPTVEVSVYGVSSPRDVYFWRVPADPWKGRLTLTHRHVDQRQDAVRPGRVRR